jgi:hypothetical protein
MTCVGSLISEIPRSKQLVKTEVKLLLLVRFEGTDRE